MTTPSPHDDERLLAFLRQHRPDPPTPDLQFSARLLAEVEQQSVTNLSTPSPKNSRRNPRRWLWLVPGVIAASLLLGFAKGRWWSPLPQIAQQTSSEASTSTVSDDEVAAFFLDNWSATIHGNSPEAASNVSESQWPFLLPAFNSSNESRPTQNTH